MNQPSGGGELSLARLVEYLDGYLEAGRGRDFCPNGLQVEGRPTVRRVVTGVSACRDLFVAARERRADAVLVHHGLFWEGDPAALTGVRYARVAELVRAGIALLAYHLPLDRHPEIGNNALAARGLGLGELGPFADYEGLPLGFQGTFPEPLGVAEVLARCSDLFGQEPLLFGDEAAPVARVGIVSGAAQKVFHQAIAEGLDLFITGEVSEWVMNLARESGTRYVAAGHYATERLGIQALGEHLADRFGLVADFVDVPNPV